MKKKVKGKAQVKAKAPKGKATHGMIKELEKLGRLMRTKEARPYQVRLLVKRKLEYLILAGGLGPRKTKAIRELLIQIGSVQ